MHDSSEMIPNLPETARLATLCKDAGFVSFAVLHNRPEFDEFDNMSVCPECTHPRA